MRRVFLSAPQEVPAILRRALRRREDFETMASMCQEKESVGSRVTPSSLSGDCLIVRGEFSREKVGERGPEVLIETRGEKVSR